MLGPQANGVSAESGPLTDWRDGKLKVKWVAGTGVGYGNCVVAKGRCFQWDRFGDEERLTCRNAETGATLWTWAAPVEYSDMYGYNNGPRSSPVVDEDLVFVFGVSGTLAAVRVEDGAEVWRRATSDEFNVAQNFFGVGSTPCVSGDLLLAMIGGSPADFKNDPGQSIASVVPDKSAIVAFNKRTGAEVYRVGNYLASYSAPVVTQIRSEPWCLAFVREGLMVFDPKDGSREIFFPWRAKTLESVNAAWPVVSGDQIFISETYELGSVLLQFDGKSLQPIWQDQGIAKRQAWRAHWATPILYKGNLFGCSGRNEPDADLRSIDFSTGNVHWIHRNRDRTSGVLVDDKLIVLGEHGLVQMVVADQKEFRVITEIDLGEPIANLKIEGMNEFEIARSQPLLRSPVWAPPTLAHGLLYLRGANKLVCLDLIPE
jgi:outer membrane protein assembly factor BamB